MRRSLLDTLTELCPHRVALDPAARDRFRPNASRLNANPAVGIGGMYTLSWHLALVEKALVFTD